MIVSKADENTIKRTIEKNVKMKSFSNKDVIIFGCTMYARCIYCILNDWNIHIAAIIDNNQQKTGKKCLGVDVIKPEECLLPYNKARIIIICSKYNLEMTMQLKKMGYMEENIIDIPVLESNGYSDSIERFNQDVEEVKTGYYVYKRMIRKYSGDYQFLICPYPGTGDIYMACSFLDEYLRREKVWNYVLVLIGNNCLRTAKLFEFEKLEVMKANEIRLILKAWEFLGNQKMNIKPLLYWGWRTKRYLYADKHPQITFTEMFLYDVFGMDDNVKRKIPDKSVDAGFAKKLFDSLNLPEGRTIIIAPYAGSFESSVSIELWQKLTKLLKIKGYSVCTNCYGEKEIPIPGTKSVIFPYESAIDVLEYAGGFIALRSGLCDIVSSAKCQMVIIYENGFNASRYEFFSLKKMGLNSCANEVVYAFDDERFIKEIADCF